MKSADNDTSGSVHRRDQDYRTLIANIPDVVWSTDEEGHIIFVSENVTKIYGYSPEDLYRDIEQFWFGRVHPDDVDEVRGAHEALVKEGTKYDFEYRLQRKDGHWIWVRDRAIKTHKYKEKFRIVGICTDITSRKQTEKELQIEKRFTDAALNSQQDTFFLFEPATGKAIRWNQKFKDTTGYTDEEISQLAAPDKYCSSKDIDRVSVFFKEVEDAGTGMIELDLLCKDGHTVPMEYNVDVMTGEEGEPKYIISIGRDIMERSRAEEAVRESNERLSRLTEASHEGIVMSERRIVLDTNHQFAEMLGYNVTELIGMDVMTLVAPESLETVEGRMNVHNEEAYEHLALKKDGTIISVEARGKTVPFEGRKVRVTAIRDLSDRKKIEIELNMTAERLKLKHRALESKHMALVEVLEHIEHNKSKFRHEICAAVSDLVKPILISLRKSNGQLNRSEIDLLEDGLKSTLNMDIDEFRNNYSKLSPREMEICDLLRENQTSKEISEHLSISPQTVDKHRATIRRKLQIQNRDINLTSFLRHRK